MKWLILCFVLQISAFSYTFPDRWQSTLGGIVSDPFVDYKTVNSVGYGFNDYTIPAFRVDEVWNTTSIHNTGLSLEGIEADHHLTYQNQSWFFYQNDMGGRCQPTASSIFPQYMFANESTYQGNTTFYGVDSYVFRYYLNGQDNIYYQGYISIQDNTPVGIYVYVDLDDFRLESTVSFSQFQEVNDPFPSYVFKAPFYCPNKTEQDIHDYPYSWVKKFLLQ
eukprot:TRINITY_DN2458_c0_g1_i2.p1 TRINITY_DN2458_c0_g1~~TRINITY_DN2458_c0_g1_i2.p1  ORF type:complete len:221 (+),score=17.08 TRINITY_DN2458_c0_g1_i2:131-793(+)